MSLASRLYHRLTTSPLWQRTASSRRQLPFALVLTLVTAVYGILMLTIIGSKCHMIPNLKHLFVNTLTTLQAHQIDAFLDFGSLLGAIREGSMIPYEFDIDVAIRLEQCELLYALKDTFQQQHGYTVYSQTDYIPQKRNLLLGYSPYITSPCGRVYDQNLQYYVDVYWYKQYTAAELLDGTATYTRPRTNEVVEPKLALLPADYAATLTRASESVWCDDDGHTGDNPGGCRPDSWLFPLRDLPMTLDGDLKVTAKVPAAPTKVLEFMYGPTWNQQKPKGYKALVCLWIDKVSPFSITLIYAGIVGLGFYLYNKSQYAWWKQTRPGYTRAAVTESDHRV